MLALLAAARRVEPFEMAAYTAAIESARALGRDDDAKLLQGILAEEQETDRKLSRLVRAITNPAGDEEEAGGGAESNGPRKSR